LAQAILAHGRLVQQRISNLPDQQCPVGGMSSSSHGDAGFQIFVKTMDFGTVTLDAKASDTIDIVKRNLRKKVESMFEGYDVELWVDASRAFNIIFDGTQLKDDKTLTYYNIQQESTGRFVYGLEGGGKALKLKKPEALKVLKMKGTKGATFNTRAPRMNINQVLDIAANEIDHIEANGNDGPIITGSVKTMSMVKLNKAKESMAQMNEESERKTDKLLPLFSDSYGQLLEAEEAIQNAKSKMEELFYQQYVEEFHNYDEKRGEASANNKGFNSLVNETALKREGQMEGRALEAQERDGERQCVIS